jgi:hypothetical protein
MVPSQQNVSTQENLLAENLNIVITERRLVKHHHRSSSKNTSSKKSGDVLQQPDFWVAAGVSFM